MTVAILTGGGPPGGGGAGIRFYCFLVCILFEDVEGVVLQNVSRLVRLVTERCTGDWKKRKRGGGTHSVVSQQAFTSLSIPKERD